MRSRDLNPEETGRAIMRLQAEQSSDFDFPRLIPVERAAELLYGPHGMDSSSAQSTFGMGQHDWFSTYAGSQDRKLYRGRATLYARWPRGHDPALDQHPGVRVQRCFHACFLTIPNTHCEDHS
jgi:hypothetical protein